MAPDDHHKSLSPEERAFLDFLRAEPRDASADFDHYCRQRPELESKLRQIYKSWRVIARVLKDAEPLRDALRLTYGEAVDPSSLLQAAEDHGGNDEDASSVLADSPKHYRELGEIAMGGMGTILRVHDQDVHRDLALKRIGGRRGLEATRDPKQSLRILLRFLEEAQITGQLEHPGIVPVHELGVDSQGRLYFTMRLVRGRDFDEILPSVQDAEESWTQARALGVILKVCEAMAYAHSKGVVHRDLKPSNVRVGRFGETYVMDWGLARIVGRVDMKDIRLRADEMDTMLPETAADHLKEGSGSTLVTFDGHVVGTPAYMSPEQARGRTEEVGPQSDVYSVGAMLYQLLTGFPPFLTPALRLTPRLVLGELLQRTPEPVLQVAPGAPSELAEICEKAMARDPADRYVDMLAMARDLEAYLGRRPISPRKHSVPYLLRLAVQRNKPVAITAAVAFVLLVSLAVTHLVRVGAARDKAEKSRIVAEQQREEADTARGVAERLLDFRSAQVLLRQMDRLYPPVPEKAETMEQWIAEVDGRLENLAGYQAELAATSAADTSEDAEQLRVGVANLERLEEELPFVRHRMRTARELRQRTAEDMGVKWDEAVAEIQRSPHYRPLRIKPQTGLVPLGPNEKGYWEFWHVLSGDEPEDGGASTTRRLASGSGIVLVLLPGGIFTMGSPESEPGHFPTELQQKVEIKPFFISKYETTQDQWQRLMGTNPSLYVPGTVVHVTTSGVDSSIVISSLHPVESISWEQSSTCAVRADLRLPTEAEWEYSCRAGTTTAYFWGPTADSLKGKENVLDLSHSLKVVNAGGADWHDGFPFHSPVGHFGANDFGLYDLPGNVSEWCDDLYETGYPPDDDARRRVFRGGSWYAALYVARAAFRQCDNPRGLNQARGVRFARDLR